MRLSLGLAFGALLGAAQAGNIVIRQNTNPGTTSAPPATTPSSSSSHSTPSSASSADTGGSSSGGGGGGGGDTTVTVTKTVSGDVKTVTKFTTTVTTVTSTVVVTSTDFTTTTVTSSDQATATKTVYETSTQFVNKKRGVDAELAPRTDAPYPASAAALPVPTGAGGLHENHLAKRATITETTTVTVGEGATTVVDSVVKTVKTVVTSSTSTQVVVTETEQANAKTTITVTSTLVVTSTNVQTGVQTSTGTPTGAPSDGNSNGNGGGGDGGLSTGAKAGIGIGAGLGALAVIGAVAFFCMRRRRGPKPDHDDFMGASEVPVGGPAGGGPSSRGSHSHHMSETSPAAGYLAPGRSPVTQASSPEGYRGTAMGDGRAGYAKPAYGSAYTSPSNTMSQQTRNSTLVAGDQLPRHPTPGDSSIVSPVSPNTAELGNDGAAAAKWHNANAAEIDGQAVMSHHSGPVYEMPTQEYR